MSGLSSPIGDFAGLIDRDMNQLGPRTLDRDPLPSLRFAKIALVIRNGRSFSVRVGRGERASGGDQDVLVGWSYSVSGTAPVQELQVQGCFADEPGWSVYPGGVWTEEPGCIELIFSPVDPSLVQGDEFRVQVPIGAPCSPASLLPFGPP
jgi:hypothetical protein